MKNRWLPRLRAAGLGALLALLMLYPQEAMEAARSACRLWASSVMPALFPYMVFSQLLASSVRGGWLTAPLAMLGGSPAGARLIALGDLSPTRAQRLAALCATVSPLFVLGTLGGGVRMLAAHWLGAVAAWAFVQLMPSGAEVPAPSPTATPKARLGLTDAIRDASLAMITVCGCMALFAVLAALLGRLLPLTPSLSALLSCVLEMASGCASIRALNLPSQMAAPLCCAAISFGGLSIFLQNAVFLRPIGVNLRTQLAARLVHAAAAYGICTLLYLS